MDWVIGQHLASLRRGRNRNWADPRIEKPSLRGHGARANLAFVTQAGRGPIKQQGENLNPPRIPPIRQ